MERVYLQIYLLSIILLYLIFLILILIEWFIFIGFIHSGKEPIHDADPLVTVYLILGSKQKPILCIVPLQLPICPGEVAGQRLDPATGVPHINFLSLLRLWEWLFYHIY